MDFFMNVGFKGRFSSCIGPFHVNPKKGNIKKNERF